MFSEATKLLKAEYLVKAIRQHRMDQAIIFCRTKLDCDNIENYLLTLGGGLCFAEQSRLRLSIFGFSIFSFRNTSLVLENIYNKFSSQRYCTLQICSKYFNEPVQW